MSTSFTQFEGLEKRQMMSASVANGVLTITGNDSNNTIVVSQSSNGNVRVAEGSTVHIFNSASVNSIKVDAKGGNDTITIQTSVTRRSTISGGAGNDTLTGSDHADRILGGQGNDHIDGRGGSDFLHGGSGTDTVLGGAGNDTLYAGTGSGTDSLNAGSGNDTLISLGGGSDIVKGGSGTDTFWVDKSIFLGPAGDTTDASSGEKNSGFDHEVDKFQDLHRVNVPIIDEQNQVVSRELNSPHLLDPNPVSVLNSETNNATFTNFSGTPLFVNNAVSINDINQGGVGDCYFQATLGAIAKKDPNFIKRNMVDLADGTYAVRFKGLFGDEFIRVDADLPTIGGQLIYGGLGDNGSMWAAIMEKAWAFRRFNTGRYDTTTAGNPAEVLAQLGINSTDLQPTGFDTTGMMNKIKNDLAAGKAAVGTTTLLNTTAGAPVLNQHCYVIDRVNLDANGKVVSVRLFNPHGIDNIPAGATDDANPEDGFVTVTPKQFMDNFVGYNAAFV